ncbi:hypothetical protein F4677DRAFT_417600 [Hypoxylon crocopeplum]|nr:hypothetical protein F4677DRAFT_417600 [Hypoxylon crocopeplum]
MSSEQGHSICPKCQARFTTRSLYEHAHGAHLGTVCHFPGHNIILQVEDDQQMVKELEIANKDCGGGLVGGKYRCRWPGCEPHEYSTLHNLNRHLRTKQKRADSDATNTKMDHDANPNNLPRYFKQDNPELARAWTAVCCEKTLRWGKYDCVLQVTESMRPFPWPSIQQVLIPILLDIMRRANSSHNEEVRRFRDLSANEFNPQDTANWTEYFNLADQSYMYLLNDYHTFTSIDDFLLFWANSRDYIQQLELILDKLKPATS